ncbi:hypothetical protein R3P38DRAFT_1799241 [Favolaschia claudopus]|uniref:PARP catalytic domain-containing protein n=1 Tax=Favolaschia claudopus TaxID=2862362 RepID=A0AAW0A676_9AGAR
MPNISILTGLLYLEPKSALLLSDSSTKYCPSRQQNLTGRCELRIDSQHLYCAIYFDFTVLHTHRALIGNIQLMWHGTIRTCTLGDDPNNLNLCTDLGCSLCRILQGGYSIDKARPTGMLGKGIYFSPLSSKASQYTRNTKSSKYHALILNRVAVGTTCTTAQARNNFTDPPAGYHSVSAGGGGGLVKFDETCIYDADMVLPIMLYLYKAP